MKRSAVIKLITDAFEEDMSYKVRLLSGMEPAQAERILLALERAGVVITLLVDEENEDKE